MECCKQTKLVSTVQSSEYLNSFRRRPPPGTLNIIGFLAGRGKPCISSTRILRKTGHHRVSLFPLPASIRVMMHHDTHPPHLECWTKQTWPCLEVYLAVRRHPHRESLQSFTCCDLYLESGNSCRYWSVKMFPPSRWLYKIIFFSGECPENWLVMVPSCPSCR